MAAGDLKTILEVLNDLVRADQNDLAVKAFVSIPGLYNTFEFKTLELNQCFFDHHTFVIKSDQTLVPTGFFNSPETRLKLINKMITIEIKQGTSLASLATAYTFSGVITNVKIVSEKGMHGFLYLEGASPTVKLERGKIMQTYSKTKLKDIFDITAKGNATEMKTENLPVYDGQIDFALQMNESDWTFTQRLCKMYGESLFYSGSSVVIGKYEPGVPTEMKYDVNFNRIEVGSRLISNQFSQYYYKRETNETLPADSPVEIEGANFFLKEVATQADLLNHGTRKPNVPIAAPVPDQGKLNELTNMKKVSEGAKMQYVSGECRTCHIRIGRFIKISLPQTMSNTPEIGLYRVIKVKHVIDEQSKYHNEFEAIPANLKYMPYRDIDLPHPYPIQAIVVENGDGLGRCKVRFPFDARECEMLIPVMSPDAGNGSQNTQSDSVKNRGYAFTPEKGDQVLVNFIDGQWVSQPFIMGSLFHSKNADALGGGVGNHVKTITDKSGGQIRMNTDETGDWYIKIHDKNGNAIVLDTKVKNIEISAPENINLTSKNISLKASEKINLESGDKYNLVAKTGSERFSADLTTTVTSTLKEVSAKHEMENQETLIKATTKVEIKSPDTDFSI